MKPEGLIALWILLDSIPYLGQSVPPASESVNDFSRLSRCSIPYPLGTLSRSCCLHGLWLDQFELNRLSKSYIRTRIKICISHPDASSAHREMTIGNNQASPEEINLAHQSQPEPTPFPRPNQQADSHHPCEPGSTAAADLAMWKQAEASRDAHKFVIVSLSGWGLLFFGGYMFFTGGKKNKEEIVFYDLET
ncbi:uncharacterized protein LOC131327995 isoform X2 [Rhododendron vialii]|uniref:uncharacterized protein LOC131327995 isoform X2 n=1 Tax=Rhododendron vialii TaxID=182163 RepID=UPI00265D7EEB|nr:uncharacterized protein LOC131327995 isoform X2 [Rhododendron vialii]